MVQLEVIRIHMRGYVVRCNTNAVVNGKAQHFAQLTVEDIKEVSFRAFLFKSSC